jgi:hypothetical protein
MDAVPERALALDSNKLYADSTKVLEERADKLRPPVVRGGLIGERIWGKPSAATV